MNSTRLGAMKPSAIVMHPGPMNRGVEISADVADGDRSLVLEQVESGVAVRMAVMYLLLGGADIGAVA
jgi:aspartate carbamoyltransferase catalytic subunit